MDNNAFIQGLKELMLKQGFENDKDYTILIVDDEFDESVVKRYHNLSSDHIIVFKNHLYVVPKPNPDEPSKNEDPFLVTREEVEKRLKPDLPFPLHALSLSDLVYKCYSDLIPDKNLTTQVIDADKPATRNISFNKSYKNMEKFNKSSNTKHSISSFKNRNKNMYRRKT